MLTAKRRLSPQQHARFCGLLQEQPMLSAYATTPLTLSLLIQMFKNNQLASHAELAELGMVTSRGSLYEAGVLHMFNMSDRRDKAIAAGKSPSGGFPPLDVRMHGEVWNFLETLAYDLHQRGTRDFLIRDVYRLGFGGLWDGRDGSGVAGTSASVGKQDAT
eukprot:SAG31_NODE_8570_length_1428_cov_1.504891_2_plen_160_part_01